MKKQRYKNEAHENITIVDTASDGFGIARINEKVIFVEQAIPGDVVDLIIYQEKKKFAQARISRIVTPSPYRITPACEHFGLCGGCKWQQMSYEGQLVFKEKQVYDALTRIGHLELPERAPIVPAPKTFAFRNKLEFTFTHNRWLTAEELADPAVEKPLPGLGFHLPGRFDRILQVNRCHLMDDRMNEIRNTLYALVRDEKIPCYDIRGHQGFLRTLTLRSTSLDQWMVLVQFGYRDEVLIERVMSKLAQHFPWLTSLLYVINEKLNETLEGQEILVWSGEEQLVERFEQVEYLISAKSFFQTNSEQALRLYELTREMAGLTGHETVYDLYTGTGSIALFIASQAAKVVGVEYVADAVEDAKKNALRNGITNCDFYAGDMKDLLNDAFLTEHGKPDVIITDPPRAGMHPDVVAMLCKIAAPRIVYVSCNPATQARDLDLMRDHYRLVKYSPVDMFPQTAHVENIALLEYIGPKL